MSSNTEARHRVVWELPVGKADWLYGTGATRTERSLVWLSALVAFSAIVGVSRVDDREWAWWQWALLLVLVVDVVGGAVANSLGSAKRFYAQEPAAAAGLRRFALNHVLFAAGHFHLFVVVAAFDAGHWPWAVYWYVVCLVSVALVRSSPLYLQRPVGAGAMTLALIVGGAVHGPAGLVWVGPVLMLKLVVAHSVTEAPFRPA